MAVFAAAGGQGENPVPEGTGAHDRHLYARDSARQAAGLRTVPGVDHHRDPGQSSKGGMEPAGTYD
ncbi:hypothetical protein GCM10027162_35620 [Streptomyces incanus]